MDDGANAPARILLVDAQEPEATRLGVLLGAGGYRVHRATDGAQAVAHIGEVDPEVILIDTRLPDGDGLALAPELVRRARTREVPLVFMGAAGDAETRVRGFDLGAVDFIAKPFEGREVLARIKRHITVARVRRALMESEAKFRSVTESAIDAIISSDASGAVRAWNKAAEAILGYPAAEIVGRPIEVIIPERFRAAHRAGMDRVSGGGPSRVIGRTVELYALHRDGREMPIELSLATWHLGDERYYTGILRDITERREAELRFRAVTESAVDPIVSADPLGAITGWNQAAERVFGYTGAEVLGRSVETLIPVRFREAHRVGMARVTQGGQSRAIGRTVELAAVRKSGEEFPVELSLSTWLLDGQRYYTAILRDISERKTAERRQQESAAELARKHEELQAKHEELRRSKDALARSLEQVRRLFAVVAEALEGTVLGGRYRLDRKLARGGFGVVYAAQDLDGQTPVAVKVLRPPPEGDGASHAARFERESLAACAVDHPNAVDVLDHGVSDAGLPYIVMELLEGETLRERLRTRGVFTVAEALSVAADVASVLDAAHAGGVVHRDVTPANVFLHRPWPGEEARVVKVLDFGIAKLLDGGGPTLTRGSEILGTPQYLAPERITGGVVGPAADVYALGVMLYEMLTGLLPFESSDDVWRIMFVRVHARPRPLQELDAEVPPALSDLALRMVATDASERPTAAEVEHQLRTLGGALSPEQRARRPRQRGPSDPA